MLKLLGVLGLAGTHFVLIVVAAVVVIPVVVVVVVVALVVVVMVAHLFLVRSHTYIFAYLLTSQMIIMFLSINDVLEPVAWLICVHVHTSPGGNMPEANCLREEH